MFSTIRRVPSFLLLHASLYTPWQTQSGNLILSITMLSAYRLKPTKCSSPIQRVQFVICSQINIHYLEMPAAQRCLLREASPYTAVGNGREIVFFNDNVIGAPIDFIYSRKFETNKKQDTVLTPVHAYNKLIRFVSSLLLQRATFRSFQLFHSSPLCCK